MAERAGYTVTMFLIDVSASMGNTREVEVSRLNGETAVVEMTNLEWSLQFVKLKIQEMIYNGRKTDQCGVIIFGTEVTSNIIHNKDGGYEHVTEFIPIDTPNAGTLAKLSTLHATTYSGDPIDAIIVGIETQDQNLIKKKTWTRKMVLLTDGESPLEIEDWEATAEKMNALKISLTIVGIDFDDEELPFQEEGKSDIKRANEEFYHKFVSHLDSGIVGNCEFALSEIARPDMKMTKSALMGTELRIGDVDEQPQEAIRIMVRASKCTSMTRPKSWKKFGLRQEDASDDVDMGEDGAAPKAIYSQLAQRTEYYIDLEGQEGQDEEEQPGSDEDDGPKETAQRVEKEQLVRGYKYGSSYVPAPDDSFPRLPTRKGIDICGFFSAKQFRRDYSMGEVQYLWADPDSPVQQVAMSSIVQAMYEKGAMAIARWVSRDGMDPKMGVLSPSVFDNVDCFLWVQMPFADDVRRYTFASLDKLVSKSGEVIQKHPYLPTDEQMEAMDDFVDAMDLMEAGEKDDEGVRSPWYDTRLSYNPAIHRVKQAQFHGAVVQDLNSQPVPPPHPELLKYFNAPRRVLKNARPAIEQCKEVFKVKQVPKKIARTRKDGHVPARGADDDVILLDKISPPKTQRTQRTQVSSTQSKRTPTKSQKRTNGDDSSETESEDEDMLLLDKVSTRPKGGHPDPAKTLPSPSPEPDAGRAPGKIVGAMYPLADFKKNIASGDLVTKAVADLAWVIKDIILKPFSSRRTDEMIECMKELRKVALEEDEIDQWNAFLEDLKHVCLDEKPGNTDFWYRVVQLGRDISLISNLEAGKLGGKSDVSEAHAAEFMRSQ